MILSVCSSASNAANRCRRLTAMPSGRYNRAMPTNHQQIEAWKARLLDLGRRNRLLHTQPGRAGGVALTDPPVETLFDALVRGRRKLAFAAALTLEQRLAALS